MCKKCKTSEKYKDKAYHIIINGRNFTPVETGCDVVIFELKHCNLKRNNAKHFHNIAERYINVSMVSNCGKQVMPVGILFSVTFTDDSIFLYVNKALLESNGNNWACTSDHQIDGNIDFFVFK